MKGGEGACSKMQKPFSSAPLNTLSATRRTLSEKLQILRGTFQGESVISSCSKHG
jgi:hypothetical protein